MFLVSGQLSKECGKQLRDMYPQLRAAALAGSKNHEIFPTLIEKLKNQNMPDQVNPQLYMYLLCKNLTIYRVGSSLRIFKTERFLFSLNQI